ncbi:DPEP2 neighbor protein-like [Lagenorhynchus albirostris]|uniref:DPEP2 neighbor protein-like n=1 Tax=Lagenorhynchus albirostris TaxID=27610 RepID=UPI0028EB1ED1|nr:DPEP2 neighbor protein-like [Lagenorhynchus albirostris]
MCDRIVYVYSNLCSVPWVGTAAATPRPGISTEVVAPVSPPTPGHYHVLYRGCGETQLGRHGETYCLVGGYRAYGDVPLATPAKVEAEKPVPRRAPKRKHSPEMPDEDLGCSRPKIRRL